MRRRFPSPACHHPLHKALSPATPHCFISCKWCGLGRKQNFISIQRGQHCTQRLDLLIISNQAPHCVLVPSSVRTSQHMTFSLVPHPQRVEMINTTILATPDSNTKKGNPELPTENHSHAAHSNMKRERAAGLTDPKGLFQPSLTRCHHCHHVLHFLWIQS